MGRFKSFHFHATEQNRTAVPAVDLVPGGLGIDAAEAEAPGFGIETAAAGAGIDVPERVMESRTFLNDESAARHFMDSLWVSEAEGPLFEITAPESTAIVPDLRFRKVQESLATNTRLLHFNQSANNVPVLGAQAIVEMTPDRNLVSIDAQIAEAPNVSAIATVSAAGALEAVANKAEVEVAALGMPAAPRLTYYRDDDGQWHLVYEVRGIPVAPPEFLQSLAAESGHGLGASPRQDTIDMTYLVDAHDGSVLLYYSETPWLDIPTKCFGMDELQARQEFFGVDNGVAFELRDPIRKIRTLDLGFVNLTGGQVPNAPVTSATFDFEKSNTAAVSAHVNATRIFDFFNDVLKRDGVDDNGMELVSIVNCTYKPPESKDWKNAVWYQNRMWYGQVQNANGGFDSYSRYLDVIAHELTHGVTKTTAGLKYLNESGALNESFSDIFGIIVKNLNGSNANDLSKWNWELGTGLRPNGGPLRDLSDPTRTGAPAHMNDYKKLPPSNDSGGVHTNSNIHNKAAFNVITSKKDDGTFLFAPEDAALMYYLTLTRLTTFATFADVVSTMQNVIKTMYAGRPEMIEEKVKAVVMAYGAVGIA
jgi:Zn-dependent metalloprotease